MRTTYLIWKKPPLSGETPDWQEISKEDFLTLVQSPEGENRHFVRLPCTTNCSMDRLIVMETTKAEHLRWKREKNHTAYLRRCAEHITLISYHTIEMKDNECLEDEPLPDLESDFELQLLNTLTLEAALSSLTDDEYRLIEFLYLSEKAGTIREYERLTGISKSTVSRRHKTILEKLKKFFAN